MIIIFFIRIMISIDFIAKIAFFHYICNIKSAKRQNNTMTYRDFGTWMRERFPYKVQKISIDAGFSCPNRDGKLSKGGCTFCNNESFNPSYCSPKESITEQIERGKEFFSKKYPDMKYLAYFQAYTNT